VAYRIWYNDRVDQSLTSANDSFFLCENISGQPLLTLDDSIVVAANPLARIASTQQNDDLKLAGLTSQSVLWDSPAEHPALAGDEVHVWRVALDQPTSCVQNLLQALTSNEIQRSRRFHFQRDRARFTVARSMMRTILGRYLKLKPEELRFDYNFYGKPSLADDLRVAQLRFNLSHSHGLALLAVTLGRRIGIDLEYVRSEIASEEIAERFFSTEEVRALRQLPRSAFTEAFFNCWTRKEAYIKAVGEGLSFPLDHFTVSLLPGHPAVLLDVLGNPQEWACWSLQELSPGSGYAAAVAVEGHDWRLRCWQG
jgi:4'-phosphopantetheinyl transferase